MKVERRKNESFERMLDRFNRMVKESGILKEWKEKSYYEKPSVKNRRARAARIKYIHEAQRERLQMLDKE